MEIKKRLLTMYNRNYGGIRLRPNPLGIANVSALPKIINFKSVTDGYTRPLGTI